MKLLTFSSMAIARLKANKRQYLSLVLGVLMSIFMISTLVFSVFGIYQAELEKKYDKVGYLDMVFLENPLITENDVKAFNKFDRIGKAYISGIVTDRNVYVGYYDEVGFSLMNLAPVEGRLPESAGEIAVEASAMDVMEVNWSIGDTVELDITPVDGTAEKRSFTLVGILPERSMHLSVSDRNGLNQFPAVLTSSQEPAFSMGRVGCHFLTGLADHATLDQAILAVWEKQESLRGQGSIVTSFYGLSVSGEHRQWAGVGGAIESDREMFSIITIAAVLGISLVLSCGVGIAGSMEGVLSKRREEIGVLRALGATRSQIRRMFGRENLILALVVSPISILTSIGAFWILSILLPESIKFSISLWLVIPIAVFSVVVILISGHLPLVRASKLMPMSVIRDTAMLRRSKRVKSKKKFSATKLIASRQVRFNPTRQIGASLLVGLMLLSSGLLVGFLTDVASISLGDSPAFTVNSGSRWLEEETHISLAGGPSMDRRSISQISSLNHVRSISIDRTMPITVLMDHVPLYATLDGQYGMLNDELFEKAMTYDEGSRDYLEGRREELRNEYLKFIKEYQIPGEAFRTFVTTLDFTPENINKLKPYIESGKIDLDAINAGQEVLVLASNVWVKTFKDGYGYRYWRTEEALKRDPEGNGATHAAWNDSFSAGQNLSLLQLYRTESGGPVNRIDDDVTVGAVLSHDAELANGLMNATLIITSEQGLENLDILTEGLHNIDVYLDGDISASDEEVLERQLNAIARRYDGYSVSNNIEYYRNLAAQNRQKIFMFASIAIVFFSVSVGMIVSSVTRQLNSEGRTIGMLRAVGADEKAILKCYSGQLNASIAGGMGISLALYFAFLVVYIISAISAGYMPVDEVQLLSLMVITICIMGTCCWLVCKFLLRFRIRDIMNKSIIENIREL